MRRVTAYWGVLAAAALATLVAATVAAALAVFAAQALPLAARHDLAVAQGTSLAISGPASRDQVTADGTQLRQLIGAALPGVPLRFYQGAWSDPLGLVSGARPARPPSAGKANTAILEAAAVPGIASHAVLVAGSWPAAPAAQTPHTPSGEPVPAALLAATAALLHVAVGDVLRLTDRATNSAASFRVSGLFAPRAQAGAGDDFWKVNTIPAAGYETLGGFATYGPLIVDPAAFGLSATGSGLSGAGSPPGAGNAALLVYQGSWVAQPDLDKLQPGSYGAVSARLAALQQSLTTSSTLGGMELTTTLPDVLRGTASEQTVAQSLLVISALQLLLLTVAALLATARLLVSQREGETALLIARGATRGQLTRLTAAEVIPLVVAAAVAGGLAGTWLAGTLARSGPLRAASLRVPGPAQLQGGTGLDALVAVVAVALCAVVALLAPTLTQASGSARPGAAVIRRGRQATVAGATRAGADLALVLLAVAAGWELRRYSAVSDIAGGTASGGSAGIDPVLALAPALALAGGTVITLRLLPFAARVTDRLAARGRGLTPALAGWQFSRQPLRSGGAALLIVMAVATGTLALAQHESWARSAADQSAFTAGASARVDLATPLAAGQAGTLAGTPGAMAVSVQPTASPEVVALTADRAASVVLLRGDQAGAPAAALFRKITPARTPGTVLPGQPAAIQLTATLTAPALLTSGRVPPGVTLIGPAQPTVTVTVLDASGTAYQLAAGTLPADGRPHRLSARPGGGHASYPLRLIAVSITYPMPGVRQGHATLTLAGPSLRGWTASGSSADLTSLQDGGGTFAGAARPAADRWQASGTSSTGTATLTFDTGYGRSLAPGLSPAPSPEPLDGQIALTAAPAAQAAIPGIATQAFLDSAPARVGSTVTAVVEGVPLPVRIVAAVSAFPTLATTGGGALIVDLSAAGEYLAVAGAPALPVTQWWLPAPPARVPPGAAVTTVATLRAQLTGEPLAAAPQQALLALAAAAALLAITGFCVSIATGVRARRSENALLAALGVTTRSAAAQLCLEKLLLSVTSAALGLALGAIVARLLVPAVTLTGDATRPVPPPLTMLALPQAITLAATVALLPVLVAAIAMIRRPDPAAELRAGQG
jgi:ABC-type antimicrobial peptide transport system permease subunit